ncbi:hypothetical protein ACFW4X_03725 [Streptomyces smyrnaeus]|uniref:Transcriptional regulator n=1 Tax=Streptomyces smyrnaeus TaxID=1387713 RepID=A0ABS3XPX1_9ACTN|nr:hypothetical protein [Streptomyces smyrnaeus]MBO8197062.1 hypothetical protein [Streptomyces smyrnaeus]
MTTPGAEFPAPADPVDNGLSCDHPLTRLLLLLEIADQPDWLRDLAAPARTPAALSASQGLG